MANRTLEELIDMLALQKENLPTYQAAVGATPQDIQDVVDEYDFLVYVSGFSETVDEDKKAVTSIKQAAYNGDEDEPLPVAPVFPVYSPRVPKSGILTIANRRNNRYKNATGYNEQIGLALGIVRPTPDPISPADVKPTVDAFPAAIGPHFGLVVGKRGQADMWVVEIQRKGSSTWEQVATATGKTADVTVTLTTPGTPEQILVRVLLKRNNEYYGQPSDPTYVTVNP